MHDNNTISAVSGNCGDCLRGWPAGSSISCRRKVQTHSTAEDSRIAAMGACATKPGDLKVKGEAPLVVEDAADKKAAGVLPAVETDPATDVSRRRSLSDLLKEDAGSDGEAEKTEPATATDKTGATEEQPTIQPPLTEQGTAEKRDAESDGEAAEAEKTEPATATDETGAAEEQPTIQPPSTVTEQDTDEKRDAANDGEAQEAEKTETAIATDKTGATEEQPIQPPSTVTEQDTAEKRDAGETPEAERKTESATATDEAGATHEQLTAQSSIATEQDATEYWDAETEAEKKTESARPVGEPEAVEEQFKATVETTEPDTAEKSEPKASQDPDAPVVEEKRVDPDSVQVVAVEGASSEEIKVADDAAI